ncbi:ABC transporter permease [Leptolyngbya sp. FACHB-261]|uniref:ABC transporter permease n=1 Tax=Leptolyngbya sp. FACHB-261 TaxID=2692806 RepID=UPI00168804DE|nr:ABC transporter permease [Leptolyngbya sp. FACHB-261]MBD2100537.1 ABC transporter permease [Leptolyngbya sp. FACHB-261]
MAVSLGRKPPAWEGLFSGLMFVFMYLPILVLAVFSFNTSRFSARWEGFTLNWYGRFLQNEALLGALRNSLVVALSAVAVSIVIGTLMAVGLARFRFPGKGLYRGVSYLPLIVPDISIAVATLVFFAAVAFPLSIITVIIAHTVFCLSYIALVVSSRLSGLNPHLEEAALDLGATPVQAFIKVLLPQLVPGILSGALLAFVLSMDDFLIASFTAGVGSATLPMAIYASIRSGVTPEINALSVILILASALVAGLAEFVRHMGDQRQVR